MCGSGVNAGTGLGLLSTFTVHLIMLQNVFDEDKADVEPFETKFVL